MKKYYINVLMVFLSQLLFSELKIISETKDQLIIEVLNEDFQFIETDDHFSIETSEWHSDLQPGAPDLPGRIINIALPPSGNLRISKLRQEIETIYFDKPIAPVPKIIENSSTHDFIFQIDEQKYLERQAVLEKMEKAYYRFYEYISIKIIPFQYDHVQKKLTIITSLKFQIDILGEKSHRGRINDNFENIYQNLFLNFHSAQNWQDWKPISYEKMPFSSSQFWYQFAVKNGGMQLIDEKSLSILPDFYDPKTVRLFSMFKQDEKANHHFELKEIPISIQRSGIYFKHQNKVEKKYSKAHLYWLTFGGDFSSEPKRKKFTELHQARQIEKLTRKDVAFTQIRTAPHGIIIYPDENTFQTQAQSYADLYPELNFFLKSQQEIFAEYSAGNPDPQAIEDFLQEKYTEYPDMLEYVILMGSGTNNWNEPSDKNKIIFFPNSDDEFVNFNNAYLAQLIIGRFPARNNETLDLLLNRLEKYIYEPISGFWRDQMLIMADDENKGGYYEGFSAGLNHGNLAQETSELINENIIIDKIFGFNYDFDEFQNKPAARDAMINAINKGRLIWYYIGHGNPEVLGDEDYFRGNLHVNLLQNGEKRPLFVAASCSVGQFDDPGIDSVAEKVLFAEDGGVIASIAATRRTGGSNNTTLMKYFFQNILNDDRENVNIGKGLLQAKTEYTTGQSNSYYYNILGDPILKVLPPQNVGSISALPDTLFARENIDYTGYYGDQFQLNGNGLTQIFEPEQELVYVNTNYVQNDTFFTVNYTEEGKRLYNGEINISQGNYEAEFIVPDEVNDGSSGKILTYIFDEFSKKDYLNSALHLNFSSITQGEPDLNPPQIKLFIDSKKFKAGDYVSSNPTLIAEIEDENGINILGNAGHGILLILNEEQEPIDITSGFVYKNGSSTKGELSWQLLDLREGHHHLKLIVYDNQNNYQIAETDFITRTSEKVSIEKLLPYPNPMQKDGYLTFIITENSDVTISIYTISGKKIRTLEHFGLEKGFNKIYWDGKDDVGDGIANGTYFYKVKATQLDNEKKSEKIGKLIILK